MYDLPALAPLPAEQEKPAGVMGEAERKRVGDKIRAARTAAGLSQQELAERAGILQRQISQIENGRLNMTFDTLAQVAAALDLQTHDLVKP